MKQVTLEQLAQMTSQARETIWAEAKKHNREPKIYLHWSAGSHNTVYEDYHINITGNGTIFACEDLSELLEHTYHRNSGAVGISLCCAYGASPYRGLGMYPPTKVQIETMAKVIQVVADGLWLTIDKNHVMTHGEAGDNEDGLYCHEDYGPKTTCERWDLEVLGISQPAQDRCDVFDPHQKLAGTHRGGDILRGKANWYRSQANKK